MKKINPIKMIAAGAVIAAATLIPSLARGEDTKDVTMTGDVRSEQESTTIRTGMATGPFSYNMFRTSDKDGNVDTANLFTLTKPVFGEKTPSTLWVRNASSHEGDNRTDSKTQVGLDVSLPNGEGNSHYLLPAWLTFNIAGQLVESDVIAMGNNDLGFVGADSVDVNYGLIHQIIRDGEDATAFYVGPTGKNVAGIFGVDYNGVWRTDLGFKAGDLGGLVDFKRNPEANDSRLLVKLAQNPGAVTNVTGPKLTGDIFVLDAYPAEQNPYLSEIQDKTNGGFAVEASWGNADGVAYGSALAGYKVNIPGGSIAASLGAKVREGQDPEKLANISASALKSRAFFEMKAREGQKPEFYLRFKGVSF